MNIIELVLHSAVMKFQEEFFSPNPWNRHGNKLSTHTNQYTWLYWKKHDTSDAKIKTLNGLNYTNDSLTMVSASSNATKKEFSEWVSEFNNLRENIFIDKWQFGNKVAFMDLYIFKGNNCFITGTRKSVYVHSVQKHSS